MILGHRTILAAGLLALTPVGHVAAADGAALYKARICGTCHGANGSHPVVADYPIIAGQNAGYLLRQMIDIRDGRRANGLSSLMQAAVAEVTDEELSVIAEWLSQQY